MKAKVNPGPGPTVPTALEVGGRVFFTLRARVRHARRDDSTDSRLFNVALAGHWRVAGWLAFDPLVNGPSVKVALGPWELAHVPLSDVAAVC